MNHSRPHRCALDWGAIDSRDAVLAICGRFHIDFAQAEDNLLAQQLGQAEERAAAAEHQEQQQQQDEEEDAIVPMPGQDLVSVSALVVGTASGGSKTARLRRHLLAPFHLTP